jgi:hypothetical protein
LSFELIFKILRRIEAPHLFTSLPIIMTQEAGGPPTVFEAVKAFKDAQEQRVNHWKEYDEAIALYQKGSTTNAEDTDTTPSNEIRKASGSSSAEHYRTEPIPMTDEIFTKILSLVTSGLLDSSHCVRAVETELRSRFNQATLADYVGKVQDLENIVLRTIVERDQTRRSAMVEGRDVDEDSLRQKDQSIQANRQEIQDLMAEINAEVAELQQD